MTSIAVVSPSFYPMIGGIESYVLGMGSELVKLGIHVDVYTPDKVLGRNCGRSEESIAGIGVHRVKVPLDVSYRIKVWPGLIRSLEKERHDLVHVYSHDSYTFFALLAARRMGAPLAITTYGPFETHSEYDVLRAGALRLYDSIVTPQIMGKSSAVFIRYPSLIQWLESIGVPSEKVHLEPSGIPKDCLAVRPQSNLVGRLGGSGPFILYLGRISPQKGVRYAVESMVAIKKKFPESRLLLIGPDYVGYSGLLRKRAEELGVTGNIVFIEAMQNDGDQMDAIAGCDVFVMPSSFEGFSQAVMKAMAQGKPVVVTNVGGLPYEVDYGKCGAICEFGDPGGLASSIVNLLSDKGLANEMAEKGRGRARSFTFDNLASRMAEQYRRLAG